MRCFGSLVDESWYAEPRGNHGIAASRQTGVHNRKKGSPHAIVCSDATQVMFFSQGNAETVVSYLTHTLIKGLLASG